MSKIRENEARVLRSSACEIDLFALGCAKVVPLPYRGVLGASFGVRQQFDKKTVASDNFGLCIHIMGTNLANPENSGARLFRANDVIFIDHV